MTLIRSHALRGDLGVEVPIIQAPMAGGPATGIALARAVPAGVLLLELADEIRAPV